MYAVGLVMELLLFSASDCVSKKLIVSLVAFAVILGITSLRLKVLKPYRSSSHCFKVTGLTTCGKFMTSTVNEETSLQYPRLVLMPSKYMVWWLCVLAKVSGVAMGW